jgi:2-C-methyl-D-erythritol 4-phosphate cytidylyltransferase
LLTAVIAAAGSGERLGAGGPKAFVPLAGRPMIAWSIDAFRACESVRRVVVAVPPGHDHGLAGEGLAVVSGGATRAQSVANGLDEVETELVAVHDAARPLLTSGLIEALLERLAGAPGAAGAIAATPVTDTIKRAASRNAAFTTQEVVNAALVIEGTVDRATLWAAQTPQLFRTEALREALAVDPARRDAATDEAMLVEAVGGTVLLHDAGAENLKVTTSADLRLAELLLAERAAAGC